MNRLSICQRIRQEAGMPGTGPTSTVSQTGDALQIVDWSDAAYEDIQNHRTNWGFLIVSNAELPLLEDQQSYTPSDLGIDATFSEWRLDGWGKTRVFVSSYADEQYITYVPWPLFEQGYLHGTLRSTSQRPTVCSVAPDDSVWFWPTPNADMTFVGSYLRIPYTMTANDDEPIFATKFHLAIVWRALMFYGAYEAANERYTHGQNEYKKLLRRMEKMYLPRFTYGAPLA